MRPLILVSNDDGVHAPGISALAAALREVGDVVVVAPDRERSAVAHAITLDRPLRLEERAPGEFAVTGTPCDCVYIALHHVLGRKPDLVASGINRGYNLGEDVFYSGTVAAAVEGALRGVPALAISLAPPAQEHTAAARFAAALAACVIERGLPPRTLLNVNVPPGEPAGYAVTRFGRRNYRDVVVGRSDPYGRSYYWIGGPEVGHDDIPGSDCNAVRSGWISVTPMALDVTAYPVTAELAAWPVPGFERQEGP